MGDGQGDQRETGGLASLRSDLLRGATTFMALAIPLLAVVILAQASVRRSLNPVALGLGAYALCFPLLRLLRARLSFRATAFTFLFLLSSLAFMVQLRGGPTGGTSAINLVFIVLAGVLFQRRGAVSALLLSLALVGAGAWLVLGGHVPPIRTAMWDPLVAESWIRGAVSLAVFGTAAAAAVLYVMQRLEREADDLRAALARERAEREGREAAEAAREQARAAMAAAQRMEVLGRMAGGVAHDFNNLLTVILSCAEGLKGGIAAGEPPDPELVAEIAAAGERAREMTRQLLAFSRRQVVHPVPLDLNALLRGAERLLRRVLGDQVELALRLQPALWTVRCDPGQLEQVLLNLAVNARDAMPGGGAFAIETENVEIGAERIAVHPFMRPGPFVRCTVRDSGHGMPAEVKAHAFEPFFTTKPEGRGTGLGLAIVYGIVKQNGGFVTVESAPGAGTTFEVLLPQVQG